MAVGFSSSKGADGVGSKEFDNFMLRVIAIL
jgi:hypothetical protein